ncbi:MAG: 1,6-anhydro-N-acetylmuramyl-L-alanine amidase AmpD [Pseudomonadota bacterium]
MHPPLSSSTLSPAVFTIDFDGWCAAASRHPSPNHDARTAGTAVDLLIVHNISLPPGEFGGPYIEDLFCNRLDYALHPYFEQLKPLRVSAHFLIRRDASLLQFVSTHQRAWHAGVSTFENRERCNDYSIGIELEGSDFKPFELGQYDVLANLTVALKAHHALTDVAGHNDVAPTRKTDPGPFFDWQLYHNTYLDAISRAAPTADSYENLRFVGLAPKA